MSLEILDQLEEHENEQLRNEHRNWQEHIRSLLGKFDNV